MICIADKPFKDREELKARIKLCRMMSNICVVLALLFALLGIIANALNKTLGLDSMTWLLLAIIFTIISIAPNVHLAVYMHLYGIESENKNK